MSTLKEALKNHLVVDGELELYNLNSLKNWPTVDGEALDTENIGIVSFDENSLVASAGGDWQEPKQFTVQLTKKNNLKIRKKLTVDGYEDNISREDFLKMLE